MAAPAAGERAGSKRSRVPVWVLVGAAFVVGVAGGALAMRARSRAYLTQTVVAVNGVPIRRDAFFRRLEMASGRQVIRQMVGEELQLQFAAKNGTLPSDAEVAKRYAELSRNKAFAERMARRGFTPDEARHDIRLELSATEIVNKGIQVSDAEIRRFYQRNVDPKNPRALYYTPEWVQMAVIVTATEAQARRAVSDMNKGIPFATVARTYSKDQSRERGGVLPGPTLRGRTRASKTPGFEAAVFGMKVGQQIGPRKFAGAWWIIRCLDKQPAKKRSFEEVKDEARTGAMLAKGLPVNSKKTQAAFEGFQRKANVQAFWTYYKDAVKVD